MGGVPAYDKALSERSLVQRSLRVIGLVAVVNPQPDFERGTLGHYPGLAGNAAAGPADAWEVCPPITRRDRELGFLRIKY